MALTEPGGGTDILGALSTFAEDKGDRWVINGQKVFITGAHVADSLVHDLQDGEAMRRGACHGPPSWCRGRRPGVTIRKIGKISCHHCESVEIFYDNVEVPKENMHRDPRQCLSWRS